MLCEESFIAQIKSPIKAEHFTDIGLLKVLCEPICCIVTIESKEQLFNIWAGIDLYKEKVGDESDGEEYFRKNVGYVKYHPGESSCTYKGKIFPVLSNFQKVGVYQVIF